MIRLLKETGILCLSEYLCNLDDPVEVQSIIGDLIDSEDMTDLTAEIVVSSKSSEVIAMHFQECFKQYVADVIDRPELIRSEFVTRTTRHLPVDIHRDCIAVKFIEEILCHNMNKVADLTEVICRQETWNAQFKDKKLKLLSGILQQLSIHHSDATALHLLKQLQSEQDANWFFLLIIIKHFKEDSRGFEELKSELRNPTAANFCLISDLSEHLKLLFNKFRQAGNSQHFYTMLIIARQLFHYTQSTTTYKSWVKSTIGEMHYSLKDQTKFMETLQVLQNVIFLESDLEILEIHAQTSITSPPGANAAVLEYKQMLRTRVAALSTPGIIMDLT